MARAQWVRKSQAAPTGNAIPPPHIFALTRLRGYKTHSHPLSPPPSLLRTTYLAFTKLKMAQAYGFQPAYSQQAQTFAPPPPTYQPAPPTYLGPYLPPTPNTSMPPGNAFPFQAPTYQFPPSQYATNNQGLPPPQASSVSMPTSPRLPLPPVQAPPCTCKTMNVATADH